MALFEENRHASAMSPRARLISFLLFLLLVLAVHSVAQGQVAVPPIPPSSPQVDIPGTTTPDATFAPENPGAMQFGAPSRFGLGQIRASVEQEVAPGDTQTTDVDGYYSGLRYVSDAFTLGGEIVNLEHSDDNSAYRADALNAAVSFPAGKAIAFGVGLDTATIDYGGVEDKLRATLLGLALNFDERLFIGLALGQERLSRNQFAQDFDSDRQITKLGVGFRLGRGSNIIHLEYYTVSRDPFEDNNGFEFDQRDASHIVIEANWGGWMASGHYSDFEIDALTGSTLVVELGWVPPKKGLAFLGHVENTSAEAGGLSTDVTALALSIGYQF